MRILIVQTAFLGDVILSTALVEELAQHKEITSIDLLVRKGNEAVLTGNPHIRKVWTFNKAKPKLPTIAKLIKKLRKEQYHWVVNCHRFLSSGVIALGSGAKVVGFDKHPLALFFTKSVKHEYAKGLHEVDRNHRLIAHLLPNKAGNQRVLPKVYPSDEDEQKVSTFISDKQPYIVIAPTSVWFTKQYPLHHWAAFVESRNEQVFLIGAPNDKRHLDDLIAHLPSSVRQRVYNMAGELSLLQVAVLMQKAKRCYANDSAPTHVATAVGASITTVFCSTSPNFGFTPLGEDATVAQTSVKLNCRPCGIHGRRKCPEGHFRCADFAIEGG